LIALGYTHSNGDFSFQYFLFALVQKESQALASVNLVFPRKSGQVPRSGMVVSSGLGLGFGSID
jgi:hypothetical protein